MNVHLRLPSISSWLESRRNLKDGLQQLHADKREAKAKIRIPGF